MRVGQMDGGGRRPPELARRGLVVGRNLTVTTYVGLPARMPELAREAIATKPDVVVAVSNVAILAVKEASSTVPIVSFFGEDPVAKGLANSLARPGGSATGVAMMAAQLDGKRASLLHEFVPAARRIAILAAARLAMWGAPRRLSAWPESSAVTARPRKKKGSSPVLICIASPRARRGNDGRGAARARRRGHFRVNAAWRTDDAVRLSQLIAQIGGFAW